MFGKEFGDLFENSLDDFERVKSKLETLLEAVHELRETNASILSTKQNETMKVLTTVTIIATVIVGVALVWVGLLAVE
jgi:Mg2+ and Co2+ transporter CorA